MSENASLISLSAGLLTKGELYRVKLMSFYDDDLKILYDFFFQTSNQSNQSQFLQRFTLEGKFIELLTFKILLKLIQKEIIFDLQTKQGNEGILIKEDQTPPQTLTNNSFENGSPSFSFERKSIMETDLPLKDSEKESSNKVKDSPAQSFDIKTKSEFTPKNYFNALQNGNFLKHVRTAIEFFKDKTNGLHKNIGSFQHNESLLQGAESLLQGADRFLKNNPVITKIEALNLFGFEGSFEKVINNQSFIPRVNTINAIIPFAIVGYHYKEIDKRNNIKVKKRKKKILFKKGTKEQNA